jgi:rhodanese-related sulfurtransferase
MAEAAEISPDELEALLADDAPVLIADVRSPAAFARGHIPGSENVPFAKLPRRADTLDAERIVTVCPHGEASLKAARLLRSAANLDGTRVESLAGGLDAWEGGLEADETDGTDGTDEPTGADEAPDAPF